MPTKDNHNTSRTNSKALTAEQKARRAERTSPEGFHRGTEVVFDEEVAAQFSFVDFPGFKPHVVYTVISVFRPEVTNSGEFEVTLREGKGDVYGYVPTSILKRPMVSRGSKPAPSTAAAKVAAAKPKVAAVRKAVPAKKQVPVSGIAEAALLQAGIDPKNYTQTEQQTDDASTPEQDQAAPASGASNESGDDNQNP